MSAVLNTQEKVRLLREYWNRYGPFRFVIETGIWNGNGSAMQFRDEAEYVAIERNDESAKIARRNGFDVRTGDSAILLPALLASRNAPALFWLDAHDSVEGGDAESSTPILAELEAIKAWEHGDRSVILVDDARCFTWPEWPDCEQLYPFGPWENRDDVLRRTPLVLPDGSYVSL